jgi:recombinational DNA repair protein RecR
MIEYNLNQRINYKLIESERVEDAPFMGALISACDCKYNCPNCLNYCESCGKMITNRRDHHEQTIPQ